MTLDEIQAAQKAVMRLAQDARRARGSLSIHNPTSDNRDAEQVLALLDKVRGIIKSYENLAFRFGAMNEPPCFRCGYDGPGYYQPETHPCAERHHKLCES